MSSSQNFFVIILIFGMLSLLGCKEEKHKVEANFQPGGFLETSKGFQIPKLVKTEIEKRYIKFVRDNDTSNIKPDEKLIENLPREFLIVDAFVWQLNDGTLSGDTVYRSPRGGGAIDLAGLVSGDKGSFFVRFEVRDPDQKAADQLIENYDAFFLSETKPQKISGEEFGSSCGSLIDVSSYLKGAAKDAGIKVNATDKRYLPVLGGTFYFVSYHLERIYIAAIQMLDSRYPQTRCEVKAQ